MLFFQMPFVILSECLERERTVFKYVIFIQKIN